MARTSLVDEAVITSPTGTLAVNALQIAAVPLTVITIPRTGRNILIRGGGPLRHSVADANPALIIAPPGSTVGQQDDTAYGVTHAIGTFTTPNPEVIVPPFSPGQYQLFVGGPGGNVVVDAGEARPGWIRAIYL